MNTLNKIYIFMLALLKLQSFIIEVSENLIYLHIHFLNFHSLLAPPFKSSSGWGHGFYIFRDTYKKRITIMWLCGKKLFWRFPHVFVEFLPPSTALLYWVWPEVTVDIVFTEYKKFSCNFCILCTVLKVDFKDTYHIWYFLVSYHLSKISGFR